MMSIRNRLALLYGEDRADSMAVRIESMVAGYTGRRLARHAWSEHDALLITYSDSIRDDGTPALQTLHHFLDTHVGDAISHVHLLPFYPFTSDDGFSVSDFRTVRPDLGSWDNIDSLADAYHLVFDGVINHVSISSDYFRGFMAGDPRYHNFFIALDPDTDTSAVTRPRDLPLLHAYDTKKGEQWIWTTFSRDQADLNYAEPEVLLEILDVLMAYAARGASMLRLDAIPYLWKELGTSCIHLPQVHEIIKLFRDVMDLVSPGLLLLSETNVPHQENVAYFGDRGDEAQLIYNFTLAPLILHAIIRGDASILSEWAKQVVPVSDRTTFLNVTATHDGIGMRPTEGILPDAERDMMAHLAESRGAGVGVKRNADGSQSLYELNVSYFDALNDPAKDEPVDLQVARFMLSQTIAMSFLGMPGIYIHSLLGSRNDIAGFKRTGQRRSVNREQLSYGELSRELASDTRRRAVLHAYRKRLQQRAAEPAFSPLANQEILDMGPEVFALRRTHPTTGRSILALHNVTSESIVVDGNIRLTAYEAKWVDSND